VSSLRPPDLPDRSGRPLSLPLPEADENDMGVTKCVCFDVTFEQIDALAKQSGGLGGAHKACGFGARCGLCVPYVIMARKSGNMDLPIMWSEDFKRFGIPAPAIERLEVYLSKSGEQRAG